MTFFAGRRTVTAVLAAVALMRCSGSSCSCIEPLDGPFPQARKISQVVQARLTPEGFDFIEQKLPTVVSAFMSNSCDGPEGIPCKASAQTCSCPAGETCQACPSSNPGCATTKPRACQARAGQAPVLGFRVPPSDGEDTDICTTRVGANWWNCVIYATLKSAQFTPQTESEMRLSVVVDVTSPPDPNGIKIEYDPPLWFATKCTVYPHISNRTITGTVRVGHDTRTDRATFEVRDLNVPFSGDDVTIDGGFTCDIADIGFVKDWIVGSFAGDLSQTLQDAMNTALEPVRTQACDRQSNAYQCPTLTNGATTACYTDDKCHFRTGAQELVPGLLGMEGKIDLASALPEFLSASGSVLFTAYAGGARSSGGSAAYFSSGGLNVGMVGGASAAANPCVPPRTRDTSAIPQFAFPATIAPASGGPATAYMLGAVVHDRLIGETFGEAYGGGLLCQEITSAQVGLINSGLVGLILGESETLAALFGDSSPRPVIMELHPREAPEAQVGLGTQAPDPNDPTRTLLDEPLLTISVPRLDIDVYTLVQDRYIRLVTLDVDLAVGLGLEINGQGQAHLVANPVDTWIVEVRARNAELLTHSAEEIAQAVPDLLAAFLPQFAPSLDQVFDLPAMRGFELQNVRFKGVKDASGTTVLDKPRYPFLGVFANLSFDPAAANASTLRLDTAVSLQRMDYPAPDEMAAALGPARKRVRAHLHIGTLVPEGMVAEHSYRIDGGLWHPYRSGNELVISDVELNLQGWHEVEVRSRVAGIPETLDDTPASLALLSDVEAPKLEATRTDRTLAMHVEDRVARPEEIAVRYRIDESGWIDVNGATDRTAELDEELRAGAFIEIEASDLAGHVARLTLGARMPVVKDHRPQGEDETPSGARGGCSSTSTGKEGPSLIAALMLGALWMVRRRSRR